MYSIFEVANLLKVGKNIVLRAAVNKGLINTLDYNRKIKKFNYEEFYEIKNEIKNLQKNNADSIKLYEDYSEFICIEDLWKYNYFENWNIDRKYRFVDLFSGAGGIAVGFTMAGMKPIQNFEIFSESNMTYELNFKTLRNIINHKVCKNDVGWVKINWTTIM